MRRHHDIFEEIKFRAALAVTQWEALHEKAIIFRRKIKEAEDLLARVNTDRLKILQPNDVDAS